MIDIDFNNLKEDDIWTLGILFFIFGWFDDIPKEQLKRYAELAGTSQELQDLEDKKPQG